LAVSLENQEEPCCFSSKMHDWNQVHQIRRLNLWTKGVWASVLRRTAARKEGRHFGGKTRMILQRIGGAETLIPDVMEKEVVEKSHTI